MRISDWSSDVCSSDLTMAAHADLIDQLLRDLLDFAMHHVFPAPNPTTGDRICVAAVGGYGPGELAPWSDVDLLFLLPYKKRSDARRVGKECGSTSRSRWSADHAKKKKDK